MPRFQHLWRHVIINTRSTWLHGDPRGFRSRDHRIHSSGDYNDPPPPGEHEGLHAYHEERSQNEIHIGYDERAVIGKAFVAYLIGQNHKVIAAAFTKVHGHILTQLPHDLSIVKQIVGEAKRASSRAVEETLPGSIWSAGGTFKPVTNRDHCEAAHDYIIYEQGQAAWTWSFRDTSFDGMYKRHRPETRR